MSLSTNSIDVSQSIRLNNKDNDKYYLSQSTACESVGCICVAPVHFIIIIKAKLLIIQRLIYEGVSKSFRNHPDVKGARVCIVM